jgi:large subunit ribosomal protein L15
MNELSNLAPPEGARRARKRVGRGPGSGTGKTAGRGQKGQKARAASKKMPGFEGGQMPMQRRLPKRGFTPLTRKNWQTVNVSALARFEAGEEVTPETLAAKGLVRSADGLVKILGNGDISVALTVKAHKFSKAAEAKISGSGGTVEVIGG